MSKSLPLSLFRSKAALPALICVTACVSAGCTSKPSAIDRYLAEATSNSNAVGAELQMDLERYDRANSFPKKIKRMLRSSSVEDRVEACESLAMEAFQRENDVESIDQLADILKRDPDQEVRLAATNAMGAMSNKRGLDEVEEMLSLERLPSDSSSKRVSFLERLLR